MIERYRTQAMASIWNEDNRLRQWLRVEQMAAAAWAELGVIPREAADCILRYQRVDARKVREREAITRHDVAAFVQAVSEDLGEAGRYFHYGLTSYDVVDTALSLLLREAIDVLLAEVDRVRGLLRDRAWQFRDVVMVGRTHGMHAEPITFGLKLAVWFDEMGRHRDRLERAREVVSVGRLAGVVGTYGRVPPAVERYVCDRLGLRPAAISTQILQRDRHAEVMCTLAIMGGTIEKMATEIRLLQRTEVGEVQEPFTPGQKGSSAMPHKRNPVICERLCGLARLLRSYCHAALENMALWHERDISHSSVERVIFPDAFHLAHYALCKVGEVLAGMRVFPERMRANLDSSGGLIYSQAVMLALIDAGWSREAAYRKIQGLASRALEEGLKFADLVREDGEIANALSRQELEACFDPGEALRYVDEILERVGIVDHGGGGHGGQR
mgnify:CR=1 FL=1